jgi:uncharacterized protein (UPF0264 family)
MELDRRRNRKLLVSVFNAQEAREAILGGARIVDSEDPRSALGNIKPQHIMDISDSVLNYNRDNEVQLSTNIGEDQLLFDKSETGQAIEKSPYEIAGKAAQAAIGVSCAMGTNVHSCNLVKVGVDGMQVDLVKEVLEEVVITLNRTEQLNHCQVMAVLFVQDQRIWDERKINQLVRNVLVELREFHPCDLNDSDAFDLQNLPIDILKDEYDNPFYKNKKQISLKSLIANKIIPEDSKHSWVKLNELFPHAKYFPNISNQEKRTTKAVIKSMVDATSEAGADAIMLDTRIQSKVAQICLVDTSSSGLIDINRFDIKNNLPRKGILSLEEIKYFVEYCHYKGIEANVAGSVQSYQAQQLWIKIPELDQISTRGAASAVEFEPDIGTSGADTRQHRVIKRSLVRGLAPPEQGGVLNIPLEMKNNSKALIQIKRLYKQLSDERHEQSLPELKCYFIDNLGKTELLEDIL